ncbi:unnamed protein product [Closterium sp. NIES-54]
MRHYSSRSVGGGRGVAKRRWKPSPVPLRLNHFLAAATATAAIPASRTPLPPPLRESAEIGLCASGRGSAVGDSNDGQPGRGGRGGGGERGGGAGRGKGEYWREWFGFGGNEARGGRRGSRGGKRREEGGRRGRRRGGEGRERGKRRECESGAPGWVKRAEADRKARVEVQGRARVEEQGRARSEDVRLGCIDGLANHELSSLEKRPDASS